MHDFQRPLGIAVKKARTGQNLTQQEPADRLCIDVRTIVHIENYKANPKLEILYPLIRALRIDPSTIFYSELSNESESLAQFSRIISQCSEEELQILIPICETILAVFRTRHMNQNIVE